MKNKKVKSIYLMGMPLILLFIFIGIYDSSTILYSNSNEIVEEKDKDKKSNNVCKHLNSVTDTGVPASISNLHSGDYYDLAYDGSYALCLEPGKRASSKFGYGGSGEGTNDGVGKALSYIQGRDNKYERAIAQIYAWAKTKGWSDEAINSAIANSSLAKEYTNYGSVITTISGTSAVEYCVFESSTSVQDLAVLKTGNMDCNFECEYEEDEDNKCKKYDILQDTNSAICDKVDNPYEFSEHTYEVASGVGADNVNKYGQNSSSIVSNYCNLYCLEQAKVILPEAPSVFTGQSTLIWPTSADNLINGLNLFPLRFAGYKECHIYIESGKSCSADDILNKYQKYKEAYGKYRDNEVGTCITTGDWDSDNGCSKIYTEHYGTIRRSSSCSGGHHDAKVSCGTEYYKDAVKYEKAVNNKNTANTKTQEAKGKYDACQTTCQKGSHCAKEKADGSCETSESNNAGYCDEHDCKTQKATYDKYQGFLNYWTDIIGKYDDKIQEIKEVISYFYNAEKILDTLYHCENDVTKVLSDSFYSNPSVKYNVVSADGTITEKTENLVSNGNNNANYKCIDGCDIKEFTEEKYAITSISLNEQLISKEELSKKINSLVQNRVITYKTDDITYTLGNTGYKYISKDGQLTNSIERANIYTSLQTPNIPLGVNFKENVKILKTDPVIKLAVGNFGSNSQFSFNYGKLNEKNEVVSTADYACKISIKEKTCECPPDKPNAGMSLTQYMVKYGITCADATEKYCRDDNNNDYYCPAPDEDIEITDCIDEKGGYSLEAYNSCVKDKCPGGEGGPACDSTGYKASEMSTCMSNKGGVSIETWKECYNALCTCPYDTCSCPADADNKGGITQCIKEYMKGHSNANQTQAANYCINTKCYNYTCSSGVAMAGLNDCVEDYLIKNGVKLTDSHDSLKTKIEAAKKYCADNTDICSSNDGLGLRIIYRTIKLENPFPSYDADATKISSLSKGTYNLDVRGRYPGSNWDSKLLVYNKIINNRGTQFKTESQISTASTASDFVGTSIYQTRKPLYTFSLTPTKILSIRRYNNSNNYDDFTLKCNKSGNDKNKACVSDFVHGKSSAGDIGLLQSNSTCYTVGTAGRDFYSCINTESP